ncbi:LLM class flavin-dependent oxidoreductase [Amycolatopsis sp. NPDC059090]|uniref:LLM class flavin-dependent oxidoreductase n=1 Tax=unclassified Amycolatopsis TaxID=2618356 RepID=UPI00366DBF43
MNDIDGRARELHLNLFLLGSEDYSGAWRHPRCTGDPVNSVPFLTGLARCAEEARLDSVFLADSLAVGESFEYSAPQEYEPMTMLAALAAATERIGLVGTASTGHTEPYNLARMFSSLDHISGGRAGWNIVTTAAERSAQNFGQTALEDHDLRYERAEDFVAAVRALWDGWAEGALIRDRTSGRYVDPALVREFAHEGPFYRVRGPLNLPRSPQGRPLLAQAGSSEAGKAFAARHAEVVFTAQPAFEPAAAFYRDVKRQAAAAGRTAEDVVVLPGISPVLGSTEAEARRLAAELAELVVPETLLGRLSLVLGVDLSTRPLDEPLDALPPLDQVQTYQSRSVLMRAVIEKEKPTLRQLLAKVGGSRGHLAVVGTPERVADEIQRWYLNGAADGFNVFPSLLPAGFRDFAEQVVPLLRERGLFRHEYTGRTLCDHYGVRRGREPERYSRTG